MKRAGKLSPPDVLERAISALTVKLNFLDASILKAG